MTGSADDWIGFETAGHLIDGPNGWVFDHSSRTRPRAEAFMKFASDGVLRTTAVRWTVCKDGKTPLEATDEDRLAFLTMLFSRIKNRKDELRFPISPNHKVANIFKVADDVNGHYEAARIELNYDRQKGTGYQYSVTSLRFFKPDIESLFQLAEVKPVTPDKRPSGRGGRPAVTDWEVAALEMARRFYLGELKPKRIADVQKQLAEWLAVRDVHPGTTALREHAKRYFEAFSTWDAE